MRLGSLAAVASGAVATVLAAAPSPAAEMALKGGFFIARPTSIFRMGFEEFVDRVNAEGKGLVRITEVVGPESVPINEMPSALKLGVIDVLGIPPSRMSKFLPGASGLTAARLDAKGMRENGVYEAYNAHLTEKANAYLLGQIGYGVRFHVFSAKPIQRLADFDGLKCRTSVTYRAMFEALGAQPIQIGRRQIFTAMERGVVDCYTNPMSEVKPMGWVDVTKYRLDPGFYDTAVSVLVNHDKWTAMSDDQRGFMKKMGVVLEDEIDPKIRLRDKEMGEELLELGIRKFELPPEEAERFVNMAYEAMWETIVERAPKLGPTFRQLTGN